MRRAHSTSFEMMYYDAVEQKILEQRNDAYRLTQQRWRGLLMSAMDGGFVVWVVPANQKRGGDATKNRQPRHTQLHLPVLGGHQEG